MLVNIDKIPYVGRDGEVSYRDSHVIAQTISDYLSDIPVFYVEFFTGPDLYRSDVTEYIDADTLTEIRAGNIHLAFHNIHEGFHNIGQGIIKLCVKYEIPTENVIILTANHELPKYTLRPAMRNNVKPPRIVLCEAFEIQSNRNLRVFVDDCNNDLDLWIRINYDPEKITHRYLHLNRRPRPHRCMLVAALMGKGLHHKGKVSFALADFKQSTLEDLIFDGELYWTGNPDVRKHITGKVTGISQELPLYLDTTDLETNRAQSVKADRKLYCSTGISLVSETTFFRHNCEHGFYSSEPGVFLSEKAWKPIIHHHPWVMVSQPHTQLAMKEKGYQTFSDLWDESYDYEQDDIQRMTMLLNLTEKISNWTEEKFTEIVHEAQKMCRHNIEMLIDKRTGPDFIKDLSYE